MKPTHRTAILCAAVAAGAALSSAAFAQPGDRQPRPELQALREAHERQRAQDLRTILRLRPDQEPALTAFLQSHKGPMPAERRGPTPEAMTTPQRLDEEARREAAHDQMRQRRAEAVRAFYAALAPDQRPAFDALMRIEGGGHGPRGWGGHGFGGPRGGPPGAPARG